MDFAILGMGLPAVYLASKLTEKGLKVGLFGKIPDLIPEPVNDALVKEFKLKKFVLNKLNIFANFSKDFELIETKFNGVTIDTEGVYHHFLTKAVIQGCEILEGSTFEIQKQKLKVNWRGNELDLKPTRIIEEFHKGKEVKVALAARVPLNEDTVEFYEGSKTWVIPVRDLAIVGGNLKFTWYKFDRAAIIKSYTLTRAIPCGQLIGETIKIGRAAGQTTKEGFVIPSLYDARVLFDVINKHKDLKIYEKMVKKSSFLKWLEA